MIFAARKKENLMRQLWRERGKNPRKSRQRAVQSKWGEDWRGHRRGKAERRCWEGEQRHWRQADWWDGGMQCFLSQSPRSLIFYGLFLSRVLNRYWKTLKKEVQRDKQSLLKAAGRASGNEISFRLHTKNPSSSTESLWQSCSRHSHLHLTSKCWEKCFTTLFLPKMLCVHNSRQKSPTSF